jgi:hypothetical protein
VLTDSDIDKAVQEIMEINGQDGLVKVIWVAGRRLAIYRDGPKSIVYDEGDMAKLLEERNRV